MGEHFAVSQTADGFRMVSAEGTLTGEPESDESMRDYWERPYIVTFPDGEIVVEVPEDRINVSQAIIMATIKKIIIRVNGYGEFESIRLKEFYYEESFGSAPRRDRNADIDVGYEDL